MCTGVPRVSGASAARDRVPGTPARAARLTFPLQREQREPRFRKLAPFRRDAARNDAEGEHKCGPLAILSVGWLGDARTSDSTKRQETGSFEPFLYRNDNFTKTGSGQT